MLFDKIDTGYSIGPHFMGSKWAGVNLTDAIISLPCNSRDKFTKDFKITAPKDGAATFGIGMDNMRLDLKANFTAYFM